MYVSEAEKVLGDRSKLFVTKTATAPEIKLNGCSISGVAIDAKPSVKPKSCPLGRRKTMSEGTGVITLPVLLSMGVGTLQESEAMQYMNARRPARSKTASHTARRTSVTPNEQPADVSDSDDSYYSDSSYYDSECSYDMQLLEHRKKARNIHSKPLHDRVQYLFDDIRFFTKPKPKPKKFCNFVS